MENQNNEESLGYISKRVKHIIVPELNAGQIVLEVERIAGGQCEVHRKSLINGELYKPSVIVSFVMEVA